MAAAMLCAVLGGPANALSMKECSAKYHEAKKDGTLAGLNWKSFRAKECGASASAASAPAATTAASPAPAVTAPTAKAGSKPATAAVASGPVTFPNAIDSKYAKESPGKARMHTCLDQYKANKAGSGNGGLRWIQKGGGYYSQCNAKLKG